MKKLLSYLFIMFIGCSVYGQKHDTVYLKERMSYNFILLDNRDKYTTEIEFGFNDSSFYISGDTVKAISMLIKQILESQKTERKYWEFLEAAVKFSNHVPDIYKTRQNNCGWSEYNAMLKNEGYITVKKKQPTKPCK